MSHKEDNCSVFDGFFIPLYKSPTIGSQYITSSLYNNETQNIMHSWMVRTHIDYHAEWLCYHIDYHEWLCYHESGLNKLSKDIKILGKVAVEVAPNIRFYMFVLCYHEFFWFIYPPTVPLSISHFYWCSPPQKKKQYVY